MSLLSPRLQLKVQQKQILTPGLVQMVTVLQLNRLELKEMITQEIVKNPVLEEAAEADGEELSTEELRVVLEAERVANPADQGILEAANVDVPLDGSPAELRTDAIEPGDAPVLPDTAGVEGAEVEPPAASDPFDEIDFGSFFDEYLDPGYKSPSRRPRSRSKNRRLKHSCPPPSH
jgi:RNA polymerase sigma-54 factor